MVPGKYVLAKSENLEKQMNSLKLESGVCHRSTQVDFRDPFLPTLRGTDDPEVHSNWRRYLDSQNRRLRETLNLGDGLLHTLQAEGVLTRIEFGEILSIPEPNKDRRACVFLGMIAFKVEKVPLLVQILQNRLHPRPTSANLIGKFLEQPNQL